MIHNAISTEARAYRRVKLTHSNAILVARKGHRISGYMLSRAGLVLECHGPGPGERSAGELHDGVDIVRAAKFLARVNAKHTRRIQTVVGYAVFRPNSLKAQKVFTIEHLVLVAVGPQCFVL